MMLYHGKQLFGKSVDNPYLLAQRVLERKSLNGDFHLAISQSAGAVEYTDRTSAEG